jgi:hypothetical protein
MCTVAWCDFSWEAFATLTTGIFAVIGASTIGYLQMKILNRQAAIAASQVELEKIKLRSELYDKRAQVYEATREWFDAFFELGHMPLDERNKTYREAIGIAEFLFRPAVAVQLRAWFDLVAKHLAQERSKHFDAAYSTALQIEAASKQVSALFEPEMRLGEPLPEDTTAPNAAAD